MTRLCSVLLVCIRCRLPGSDPAAPSPGAALLTAAQALTTPDAATRVQGIECVSGCKRPCAVALVAPARVTYLFGDLSANAACASDLLHAAREHATAPDGWLPRAARPSQLQAAILARIPPLHWLPAGGDPITWPT